MINNYESEERKGTAEGNEWIDKDIAVKADTPLVDSATGKKVIVRLFDFDWNKEITKSNIKEAKKDKQLLFNVHATYIKNFLWKDGLNVLMNQDPKLIFTKKGYRIAVVCEARSGQSIFDKPQTLQNIFKK